MASAMSSQRLRRGEGRERGLELDAVGVAQGVEPADPADDSAIALRASQPGNRALLVGRPGDTLGACVRSGCSMDVSRRPAIG